LWLLGIKNYNWKLEQKLHNKENGGKKWMKIWCFEHCGSVWRAMAVIDEHHLFIVLGGGLGGVGGKMNYRDCLHQSSRLRTAKLVDTNCNNKCELILKNSFIGILAKISQFPLGSWLGKNHLLSWFYWNLELFFQKLRDLKNWGPNNKLIC
jgi:hypothetical protein